MPIFDGYLIISDIDGTLLDNGILPERNCEKIKYFISRGGKFSLSTGRVLKAVSAVTEKIEDISPSILANGAMIYDFKNRSVLFGDYIGESGHRFAEYIIENHPEIGLEIHSKDNIFSFNATKENSDHEKYENFKAENADFSYVDSLEWTKVIYLPEPEFHGALEKEIDNSCAECDFFKSSAMIFGEKRHYFEQVNKGVSKAKAAKRLCEILKINPEKCCAAGDYYNDLEVLKTSGYSGVPYEAPDDIKSAADEILCSVKKGCVGDFIDRLENRIKNSYN